jgi:hypothetical protein
VADARMLVFDFKLWTSRGEEYIRSITNNDGTSSDIYFFKKQKPVPDSDYYLEGELFSNVYYKPATYDWDLNLDGAYDNLNTSSISGSNFRSPEMDAVLALDPPYPTACYNIKEPQAIVCPVKFKIMDNMFPGGACSGAHCKEDVLYFGVEGDTFCKESGLTCVNNVDCCSNFCNPVGNICQNPL